MTSLHEKTEKDTDDRVGVLIFKDNKILIEHAPNKPFEPNSWDLPKGHISKEDDNKEYSAKRECFEETGLLLDKIHELSVGEYITKYDSGTLTLYYANINQTQLSDCSEDEILSHLSCYTFFEENGKKLPEASEYKFIKLNEIENYLYASLVNYFRRYLPFLLLSDD